MAFAAVPLVPFVPGGNDLHVILLNADDYTVTSVEFLDPGVYAERSGIDRLFFPWSNVAQVYQDQ